MVAELGLSFSDGVILIAVVLAGVKVLADYRGWTRSPALVRQENADLRERNATLEADVKRLDAADREKAQQIAVLESQIADLKKQDQAAVLAAIAAHDQSVAAMAIEGRSATDSLQALMKQHETNAASRHERSELRHVEALDVWREIRDSLRDPQQQKGAAP